MAADARVLASNTGTPLPLPKGVNPLSSSYEESKRGEKSAALAAARSQAGLGQAKESAIAEGVGISKLTKPRGIDVVDAAFDNSFRQTSARLGKRMHSREIGVAGIAMPKAPPGSEAVMKGSGAGRRTVYVSAPQYAGHINAPGKPKGEGGVAASLPEDAITCGKPVIAEASFQLRMPNGTAEVIRKGDVIDDPGAVMLIVNQGKPIRLATSEELREYCLA